jgi:hypothetical protein
VKKWLANAELVARQLKSFFDGTGDIPRIIRHMPASSEAYSGLFASHPLQVRAGRNQL